MILHFHNSKIFNSTFFQFKICFSYSNTVECFFPPSPTDDFSTNLLKTSTCVDCPPSWNHKTEASFPSHISYRFQRKKYVVILSKRLSHDWWQSRWDRVSPLMRERRHWHRLSESAVYTCNMQHGTPSTIEGIVLERQVKHWNHYKESVSFVNLKFIFIFVIQPSAPVWSPTLLYHNW